MRKPHPHHPSYEGLSWVYTIASTVRPSPAITQDVPRRTVEVPGERNIV